MPRGHADLDPGLFLKCKDEAEARAVVNRIAIVVDLQRDRGAGENIAVKVLCRQSNVR